MWLSGGPGVSTQPRRRSSYFTDYRWPRGPKLLHLLSSCSRKFKGPLKGFPCHSIICADRRDRLGNLDQELRHCSAVLLALSVHQCNCFLRAALGRSHGPRQLCHPPFPNYPDAVDAGVAKIPRYNKWYARAELDRDGTKSTLFFFLGLLIIKCQQVSTISGKHWARYHISILQYIM